MPPMQRRVDPSAAWLSRAVLAEIVGEAARAEPCETGGVLMGYWAGRPSEPVITYAVGPGPGAVHERTRFVPDHEYQSAEIAKLYRESGRRLCYLGDWHTHPGAAAYLSEQDLRTLNRIAAQEDARAPRPLMLVLGGEEGWLPKVWAGRLETRLLRRPRLLTRSLVLRLFDDLIRGA